MQIEEKKGIPKIIGLPLATVGEHIDADGKKVVYTLRELQETAASTNKFIKEGKWCPLVVLHEDNDDAVKDDEVYARAEKMYMDGDTLKTDMLVTEGKEKELKSGRFEPVSMTRFRDSKRIYQVSLVGDQAISKASLKNAKFENFAAEHGDVEVIPIDSVDFSTEGGTIEMENKEETFSEKTFFQKVGDYFGNMFANQKAEIQEEIKKTIEEFKAPEKVEENKEEDMDNIEDLKAKAQEAETFKAKYEALENQIKTEKEEFAQAQRKSEAGKLYEQFSAKGCVVASQKELVEKLLLSDMAETFKAFLALNKLVDFDSPADVFSAPVLDTDDVLSEETKKRVAMHATNI